MTGGAEEFDWLDDLTAGVETRNARLEERRKLRADIDRLDELDTLAKLSALHERVASAIAGTKAGIEVFRQSGDFHRLASAQYALEMYERAIRRINGRRRSRHLALEEKRKAEEEKRKAEKVKREETRRGKERLAAEVQRFEEEEKTKRHMANRQRDANVRTKVIQLILSKGLLDKETVHALFQEAEELVDGEGAGGATRAAAR